MKTAILSLLLIGLGTVTASAQNLIENGYGELGDNTNFPSLIFDGTDRPLGSGSFYRTSSGYAFTSNPVPYLDDKTYVFEFSYRSRNSVPGNRQYAFIDCFDSDGKRIDDGNVLYLPGTTTTLAQPLNPGDQYIYLTSLSGWHDYSSEWYRRGIKVWNYVDASGYAYPPETYTRNFYQGISGQGLWDFGQGLEPASSRIKLKTAWGGPSISAGTSVSQNQRGGTYLYVKSGFEAGSEWTRESFVIKPGSLRPGTAFVGVGWIFDYTNCGNQFAVSGVSLTQLPYAPIIAAGINVGIGVTNPQNALDVNGTVRAKEVIVATNWADFVFDPEYRLPSLAEVEAHIAEKRSLPGVPTAAQVQQNGLSLAESQTLMMQKIEELTLYVIELKKENEIQKQLIKSLDLKMVELIGSTHCTPSLILRNRLQNPTRID